MTQKYKSKIGPEIIIPLVIIFGLAIFSSRNGYTVWSVLFLAPPILFVVYLFQNTYYTIEENLLIVKSGFLVNTTIDINLIYHIKETSNILSAPALSLDRLEIKYETSKRILISPDEKEKFIKHLLSINDSIKIETKK